MGFSLYCGHILPVGYDANRPGYDASRPGSPGGYDANRPDSAGGYDANRPGSAGGYDGSRQPGYDASRQPGYDASRPGYDASRPDYAASRGFEGSRPGYVTGTATYDANRPVYGGNSSYFSSNVSGGGRFPDFYLSIPTYEQTSGQNRTLYDPFGVNDPNLVRAQSGAPNTIRLDPRYQYRPRNNVTWTRIG
uniref:Uncharacterized protein n=1 Tax=Cacopsylla melanoneura TaxID=428564 RepID=A0A8D8RYH7_9HEMI